VGTRELRKARDSFFRFRELVGEQLPIVEHVVPGLECYDHTRRATTNSQPKA